MSNSDLDKVFRLKDEKDWVLWKFQITILMKFQEVFDYASGKETPPSLSESTYDTLKMKFDKNDI